MTVRPPAVAGLFYPSSEASLRSEVDRLLTGVADAPTGVRGVVAPHAGYAYSGPVAGSAFRALGTRPTLRVVLLGPPHRWPVRGIALPVADAFETPLGRVTVDEELMAIAREQADAVFDDRPHAEEHALEVELPFLQRLTPQLTVLPVLVGSRGIEAAAALLRGCLASDPDVRIVVSSDLSHYLAYEVARRRDEETARQIVSGGPPLREDQACGAWAINALLALGRSHGLELRLLDLRSSGDTSGDRGRVVGYGAFSIRSAA